MTTLYETILPDGSKLWYASAVPSQSGDFPPGFVAGDLLMIVGGTGAGQLYICTVGGSPGTWQGVLPNSGTRYGSQSATQFFTGDQKVVASTQGVDTAGVSTQVFVGAVLVTAACTLTGVQFLVATGGTDHVVVVLYNAAGAVVANSALDATTNILAASNTMQQVPFTAPYKATGPALYFIGVSTNGSTGHIRTQFNGSEPTTIVTGATYATLTALTVPTSFTTAQSPVGGTY